MAVERTGKLPAAPEQVWEKISNPNTYGEWQATHVGLPDGAPESLSTGDTFKEKVTLMGMPGEIDWTVTEATAPSMLRLEGAGPMGVKATMSYGLEGENGGTRCTFGAAFEGAAIAAMMAPLEKSAESAADQSIEKLRAAVS